MPRTINDVIDDLGCGHAQFLLCLFGGGLYWVDGVVMTLFATLPSAIAEELGLDRFQRATLFSSAVVGLLIGNYTNIVNDSYFGRRKPILFGYVCAILCVMASAAFTSFWAIVWCWAMAGFGLGLGLPAWNALCVESSPSSKRMLIGGVSQVLYSIASITTLAIELHYSWSFRFGSKWREIIIWTQLPSILLFVCAVLFGFADSAHAHMAQGNEAEARATLETMRLQNNRPHVSIDFDTNSNTPTLRYGLIDIFKVLTSKTLLLTTLTLCMTTAVINFVGYGFGYSLPIMLPKFDLGIDAPITIMGGCVAEVVGYTIAINASSRMPRISQMIWFFSLTILYCVIIAFGIFRVESSQSDIIGKICIVFVCTSLQAVTAPGWLVVYTYAAEVFPTVCRSFAGGFVIGCGRIGSILAPFLFEAMYKTTQSYAYFFTLLCVLMTVVMACIVAFLRETKDVPLEISPIVGEKEPLLNGQNDQGSSTSTFPSSPSKLPSPSGKLLGNQNKAAFSDF